MDCRICGYGVLSSFGATKLLGNIVKYYECPQCKYVFTETPTWLQTAYINPINRADVGICSRNISNLPLVIATLCAIGKLDKSVVDYAGGYGLLVRLLRDKGIDAWWTDPYATNLFAKGFELCSDVDIALGTAFEVLEHYEHPLDELQKILRKTDVLLMSTLLMPEEIPRFDEWWYYGLDHGQHIGFFRKSTMSFMAQKLGMHYIHYGSSIHIFSKQLISIAKWRFFYKLAQYFPWLITTSLKSLTWSDYLLVTKS